MNTVTELADAARAALEAVFEGEDEALGDLPGDFPVEEIVTVLYTDVRGPLRRRRGKPWAIKPGTRGEVFRAAAATRNKALFHGGANVSLYGLFFAEMDIPKSHPWYTAVEALAVVLLWLEGRNPNAGRARWAEALGGSVEQADRVIQATVEAR